MPRDTSDPIDLDLWFYNLDNGRPHDVVQRELEAIASTGPAFIGGCEATGYQFDPLPGLVLARDRSRPARANIASWVREDLARDPTHRWHDLKTVWPRTDFPGTHEPRSYQHRLLGWIPVLTAHQPPPHLGHLTEVGQAEGIEVLARAMAPWLRSGWEERPAEQRERALARPRVLLWDANRRPGEPGPGPTMLAEQIGGRTVGHRIDGAVLCGDAEPSRVEYPERVAGVELKSDHHHAFRFTLTVDRRWLEPPDERH
jgi:hypothetical protein